MRTFEIEPQIVVHDMHPGYLSTSWAKEWAAERKLPLIAVQHHHAHIAACMAEHGLDGPVIGLALDGTGYGTDGRIWGGEVLIAGSRASTALRISTTCPCRAAKRRFASRGAWRWGICSAAGFDVESPEVIALLGAKPQEAHVLKRMIERELNTPLTSSCGRLFDAVAAVVLRRGVVDYEAQAAIELEGLAIDEPYDLSSGYSFELLPGDWTKQVPARISAAAMWRELLRDLQNGTSKARIAARFHAGVAAAFIRAAIQARSCGDWHSKGCALRRLHAQPAAGRGCCAQVSKPKDLKYSSTECEPRRWRIELWASCRGDSKAGKAALIQRLFSGPGAVNRCRKSAWLRNLIDYFMVLGAIPKPDLAKDFRTGFGRTKPQIEATLQVR